jgi:SnoaL-like domain
MQEMIERYREASVAGDVAGLMSLLAPDAELISPISGRLVFRGQHDLRVLFEAVYSSLKNLVWYEQVADGRTALLRGEAAVGPFKLGDAMVIELSEDGLIRRIRPHFRPWLGLTAFALVVGPKLARRPSVLIRALRH